MFKREYCKESMLPGYIELYAQKQASWKRFWSIVKLDFSPEFLKGKEFTIKRLYNIKVELRNEQKNRYVAL